MSATILVCFPGVFKSAFYHELSGMTLSLTNVRSLREDNSQLVKTVRDHAETVDIIIVNYDKALIEELSKEFKVIMIVPDGVSREDWFKRPYFEHLDKLDGLDFSNYADNYDDLVWEANCLEIEGVEKIAIKKENKFLKDKKVREVLKRWKKN